jgi:hypothetical protein
MDRRSLATTLVRLTVLLLCGCGPGKDTGAHDAVPEHIAPADSPEVAEVEPEARAELCTGLFGRPAETTGLSSEQCQPSCACEGITFEPPHYEEDEIAALESLVLATPFSALEKDPYQEPDVWPLEPDKACGILLDAAGPGTYSLQTYSSPAAAEDSGAVVTHYGACGLCSPLVNLGVYIRNNDLAGPVRQCGIDNATKGKDAHLKCLTDLGFDHPCAQIWYYNTRHTQQQCLVTCLALLEKPYHNEDGSLNDCIQCDEDVSGAVFKAVSGRTRRNSGLPTALCRPCESVAPVVHRYW